MQITESLLFELLGRSHARAEFLARQVVSSTQELQAALQRMEQLESFDQRIEETKDVHVEDRGPAEWAGLSGDPLDPDNV